MCGENRGSALLNGRAPFRPLFVGDGSLLGISLRPMLRGLVQIPSPPPKETGLFAWFRVLFVLETATGLDLRVARFVRWEPRFSFAERACPFRLLFAGDELFEAVGGDFVEGFVEVPKDVQGDFDRAVTEGRFRQPGMGG